MKTTITSQQICGNFQHSLLNYFNSVACNYQAIFSFSACTARHWTSLCCFPSGARKHTAMLNSPHFVKHLMKLFWEKIRQKWKVFSLQWPFWWAEQLCTEKFEGRSRSVRSKVDSCQHNHFQITLLSKTKQVISLNHSSHSEVCHCCVRTFRLLHCYMGSYGAFSSGHMGLMDDSALKGRVHSFIRNFEKKLFSMAVPRRDL